ncbi:hypothetical protein ILYODFUR_011704 [Ilyodon furcidens]|uniref:Uncharacterized protein n=1 Tax=Ilyodon furcidens TaxID=33524 RepID=A0ABV0U4M7_9TELE
MTPFFSCRLCQLRQSSVGTGSHSGHEWLPDRYEAAEGAAEALQERQQTLLILALGLSAPPVSTARNNPSPCLLVHRLPSMSSWRPKKKKQKKL